MNPLLRKIAWTAFALFIFVFLCVTDRLAADRPVSPRQDPTGTWKLISTKYGAEKEFTKYAGKAIRLKLINNTYFAWFEVEDGKVNTTAGGPFTLDGNSYIETIQFATGEMKEYLGKPQKFTIKVDGDKFFQAGDLSTGFHIEENWERVRQ
jgi:hypothetical protein